MMEAIALALIEAALAGYNQWKTADAATQAQLEANAVGALATLKGEAIAEDAGHALDLKAAEDAIKGNP